MARRKGNSGPRRPSYELVLGSARICLGRETKVMGILNVTPDSFSDGGRFVDPGRAEERALRMECEGASMIDIGGESSRPGASPVSAAEEIRRIRPVMKRIAGKVKVPISIDTTKKEVAAAALDMGAVLVNDIHALGSDKKLARLIARYKAGVVLMHMQGTPQTMQREPVYRDVVEDISRFLVCAVGKAREAGISKDSIVVDPGLGFGKTAAHNFQILSLLDRFWRLKYPLLVGASRKSFIGQVLESSATDRLAGSLAAAAAAVMNGAHILRVHDVLPHVQLCRVLDRVLEAGSS